METVYEMKGMRMDNGIGKRQNEEISIQKLAAQRQLYREAKRKQTLSAVFCVAVPFLLSAAEAVIGKTWALTVILALISVLSMYISRITDKYISEKNGARRIFSNRLTCMFTKCRGAEGFLEINETVIEMWHEKRRFF